MASNKKRMPKQATHKEKSHKKSYIIIVIIAALLLAVLVYPKDCGNSYGGFITQDITMRRQECTCIGIKYESHGNPFYQVECSDCGTNIYCAGIPTDIECYEWNTSRPVSSEEKIECYYK